MIFCRRLVVACTAIPIVGWSSDNMPSVEITLASVNDDSVLSMPMANVVGGRLSFQIFCNEGFSPANIVWSVSILEPFSNYTFPGIHERNRDACRRNEDCGDQAGVKCDYLSYDITYKVCQCKDGWLLDPKSQICGKTHSMFGETCSNLVQSINAVNRNAMRLAIWNVKDTTACVNSAIVSTARRVVSEKRFEDRVTSLGCSL